VERRLFDGKKSNLGKIYAKHFLKVYSEHRWPGLKKTVDSYGPKIWTKEMFRILDKIADKMKLEWKQDEMLRIDKAYYRGDSDCPTVVVEHENGYKGIWDSELPRLFAADANLRVLICYPPEKEHFLLQRRIKGKLNTEMQESRFDDEFLLILGKNEVYPRKKESFNIYWFYPGIYGKKLIAKSVHFNKCKIVNPVDLGERMTEYDKVMSEAFYYPYA
jgi:hypothetical protein